MDGDAADVDALRRRSRAAHGALLVLDEAHAVLGPQSPRSPPTPTCCASGRSRRRSASLGGFVAGPARYVELVVNTARPYIFTTAPTPADTAAARAALAVLGSRRRRRGSSRSPARARRPLATGPPVTDRARSSAATRSRALAAAAALLDHGLLVPAIRPPTVAPGTSRLRVTLSAAHTDEQVEQLEHALAAVFGSLPSAVIVLVAGTGTDVGKTWVTAATAGVLRGRNRSVRGPQAGAVVRARRHAHGRATCSPRQPGNGRKRCARRHRWFAVPMAPPMAADALEPAAVHRLPSSSAELPADDAGVVFVEERRRCALPARRPTATPSTLADACAPAIVVLVADAGPGHDQPRCGSPSTRSPAPSRGRVPQSLRPRRRSAPPQPRLAA